uniref:Orange domain-containing protein n=2 Tax=Lutzomyia longipalpis TaxID=7200 RepID=A0A1B0CLK6_LUTLO
MMPIQEDLDKCNNNGGNSVGSGHSGSFSGNVQTDGGHSQGGSLGTPTPTMTKAELRKPARHTKLEKADILEMTVKHLQTIQRQQFTMAVNTDPTVIHKFKSGFSDCAEEVTRYVNQMDGLDSGVKQRLANHLNNCVSNIQQVAPPMNFPAGSVGLSSFPGLPLHNTAGPASSSVLSLPQDVNNNGRIQMGGVQLIPSRLPTGELALVMPNSSNLSFFPNASPFTSPPPPAPTNLDLGGSAYARSSAFSSVRPLPMRSSPPISPVSSISSCGEESQHSSDYHNSSASPPAASCSGTGILPHLQQPQVSSTTETSKARLDGRPDVHYVNKKRPYPFEASDVKYDVSPKAIKLEAKREQSPVDHNQNGNTSADMWRPW